MNPIKIGVAGCGGRMGRMILRALAESDQAAIAGGIDAPGSESLGQDLGTLAGLAPLGVVAGEDPEDLFAKADVVVEFTSPAASVAHAALAARHGTAQVIGTTGLDTEAMAALERAAADTSLVYARNTSLGVTLLTALVEQVAATLGPETDIEVLEMHHRRKVDAPSGTALALGEAAAKGRGVALDEVAQRVRDGITGARPAGEIGFATLRGGDVVGDHSVIFAAEGERLELTHKATSRDLFARGAVRAALWVAGKPPGLYDMRDVLGLK